MGLRIRFQNPSGATLGYSIERLVDGLRFDFADSTFKANPTTPISSLPENPSPFSGTYSTMLASTPVSQFLDGNYAIGVHDLSNGSQVVALLGTVMHNGDDSPVFPVPTTDPWAATLPGNYATGTVGALLSQNLDAKVSSRSTYAGGPVASVTAPVTVGVVNDKSGYLLASAGLDAIIVENGINARQALAPILAAAAGVVTGAGTGTILIRGANAATTRITATTDNAGNRSSVAVTLPT